MQHKTRYQIRPYVEIFDKLCYASFLRRYWLEQKQIENNLQIDKLVDEVIEVNNAPVSSYLKV